MKKENIPKTDSIQKLAHFWDTHDLTDFDYELEEVKGPVFDKDTVLKIHLQHDEANSVMKIAKSKGTAPFNFPPNNTKASLVFFGSFFMIDVPI